VWRDRLEQRAPDTSQSRPLEHDKADRLTTECGWSNDALAGDGAKQVLARTERRRRRPFSAEHGEQQDAPPAAGAYELRRIGDAVTNRVVHASIYDAARLCMAL
jgi:hypothetical protein